MVRIYTILGGHSKITGKHTDCQIEIEPSATGLDIWYFKVNTGKTVYCKRITKKAAEKFMEFLGELGEEERERVSTFYNVLNSSLD